MTRLDLFLRAGGQLDPNTWSLLDISQRDAAAAMGDTLRLELAASIADALLSRLMDAAALESDSLAQQVTDLMAAEVKA